MRLGWPNPARGTAAILLAAGVLLTSSPTAGAVVPQAAPSAAAKAPELAPLLRSTDQAAQRFRAVGRFFREGHVCTATAVAPSPQVRPDAKVLVLTAGHCIDLFDTNSVRVNQPVPAGQQWHFTPAYFIDTVAQHRSFPVSKVHYATMKGVDLAVAELDATYADLAAIKVSPLTMSAKTPFRGEPVEVVHAPVDNIPVAETYLRHSLCRAGDSAALVEGSWLWQRAMANDCKGIYGGSSGSPMVSAAENRIVAVTNTVVDPWMTGCGPNRPCETGPTGVTSRAGAAYAIPVSSLIPCVGADAKFDLRRAGCQLDPGYRLDVNDQRGAVRSGTKWEAALSGEGITHARVKTGPLGRTDCADPRGYGSVFALADRPVYDAPLPGAEDYYVLCAVGGSSAMQNTTWQPYRHAAQTYVQVDDTPPTVKPIIDVFTDEETTSISPSFNRYDIAWHAIKYGPRAEIDCANPDGYFMQRPFIFHFPKADGPARFCLIPYDRADNAGQPYTTDVN